MADLSQRGLMMKEKILKDIKRYGKSAQGKREYVNYLEGKRITFKQAILALCYSCTNFYADGKNDCLISHCPLYPFMPYRGKN